MGRNIIPNQAKNHHHHVLSHTDTVAVSHLQACRETPQLCNMCVVVSLSMQARRGTSVTVIPRLMASCKSTWSEPIPQVTHILRLGAMSILSFVMYAGLTSSGQECEHGIETCTHIFLFFCSFRNGNSGGESGYVYIGMGQVTRMAAT